LNFFKFFAFIIHSSFKSIKGEGGANVLNETCDKKIPPTTLVLFFPFFKLQGKVLNGLMKAPNGLAKLVNVMRFTLQNDY